MNVTNYFSKMEAVFETLIIDGVESNAKNANETTTNLLFCIKNNPDVEDKEKVIFDVIIRAINSVMVDGRLSEYDKKKEMLSLYKGYVKLRYENR